MKIPIGAWAETVWNDQVVPQRVYISFGKYHEDQGVDSYGKDDDEIFFYSSIKELDSMLTGETKEDWSLVSYEVVYKDVPTARVNWIQSPNYFAQDACFYERGTLAEVSNDQRVLVIMVEGETKAVLDNQHVLKTAQDFRDHKIFTDGDLVAYENRITWELNPWFDMYELNSGGLEHLDRVGHRLYDDMMITASQLMERANTE